MTKYSAGTIVHGVLSYLRFVGGARTKDIWMNFPQVYGGDILAILKKEGLIFKDPTDNKSRWELTPLGEQLVTNRNTYTSEMYWKSFFSYTPELVNDQDFQVGRRKCPWEFTSDEVRSVQDVLHN